jgi:hypothetical protein
MHIYISIYSTIAKKNCRNYYLAKFRRFIVQKFFSLDTLTTLKLITVKPNHRTHQRYIKWIIKAEK